MIKIEIEDLSQLFTTFILIHHSWKLYYIINQLKTVLGIIFKMIIAKANHFIMHSNVWLNAVFSFSEKSWFDNTKLIIILQ